MLQIFCTQLYDRNLPIAEQRHRLPEKVFVPAEELGAFELMEGVNAFFS